MRPIFWMAFTLLGWAGIARAQQAEPWAGRWIQASWSTVRDGAEADGSRPMPAFGKVVTLREKPVHAELRIAGLGQYQASIDGRGLAAGLHGAWTDYRKTVTYDTHDLGTTLGAGRHVLRITLGNGMYNVQRTVMPGGKSRYTKFEGSFGPPKLIAELRLRFADGRVEVIGTDTTWRVVRGATVFSSTYGGEDFDARRLLPPWTDDARFGEGAEWSNAQEVAGPGGLLRPALAPDVIEQRRFVAKRQTAVSPDKVVYDFGSNFAGFPSVRVSGPPGATLKLTPGELLNADGTVSQRSSGGPMWWSYTLQGGEPEEWRPQFGYYGFRYLQAEWIGAPSSGTGPGSPHVLEVAGIAIHSASPSVGAFSSSNELLNQIHELIVAAMHNNEMSLMTDCPHREKLGWLEETHLVASGLMFNDDLQGLYRATALNIADAQASDGMVPTIAPQYTKFGPKSPVYDDSPEWGSASILAAWSAYRFYGDADELARNYPAMQHYLSYLEGKADNGIVAYGLGDWYDIGPGGPGFEKNTTLGVTGTLMLYEDAATMRKIAILLGHLEDAARYAVLADREKAAFNTRFWNAKTGVYDTGSQTANAMPLALGIVPEERKAAVLADVIADIHAHEDHVTAGEVGYPYLVRALLEAGRSDVLLAMMLRNDPPSYGSQLAAGATALTEAWDANPKNSQDHFMLGSAEEWFYRGLGGIDFDLSRTEPSERITIRPQIVSGLGWVRSGFQSRLGKIESDWKREPGVTSMDVTIPDGTTATIVVPLGQPASTVTIGHKPAEKTPGVGLVSRDAATATYLVHAGTYPFRVTDRSR